MICVGVPSDQIDSNRPVPRDGKQCQPPGMGEVELEPAKTIPRERRLSRGAANNLDGLWRALDIRAQDRSHRLVSVWGSGADAEPPHMDLSTRERR